MTNGAQGNSNQETFSAKQVSQETPKDATSTIKPNTVEEEVAKEQKKSVNKRMVAGLGAGITIAVLAIFIVLFINIISPTISYEKAGLLYSEGNYNEAANLYEQLGDYKDSQEKLADTNHQIMLVTYDNVYKALAEHCWYYEPDTVNSLYRLSFNGERATDDYVFYDGNGINDGFRPSQALVTIDDNFITIAASGEIEKRIIPYTYTNGTLEFGSGEYISPSQVEHDLQGYWTDRSSSFALGKLLTNEYNIYIHDGEFEEEHAAEAFNSDGYYYYGPNTGTYSVGFGTLNVTGFNNSKYYYFRVSNGKAIPVHYGHDMTQGNGLKGEDGYEFQDNQTHIDSFKLLLEQEIQQPNRMLLARVKYVMDCEQ